MCSRAQVSQARCEYEHATSKPAFLFNLLGAKKSAIKGINVRKNVIIYNI